MSPSRGSRPPLPRRRSFQIKIGIREQLSVLVALIAMTAVSVLSLIIVCMPSSRQRHLIPKSPVNIFRWLISGRFFAPPSQWFSNSSLIQDVTKERISMSVSMKSAQISQTFGTIYSVANNVAYTPSLRSSMSNYENTGKNIESNWFNALTDLKNISSTPSLSGMEVYQIAVFDARLGNGSSIWVYEGTEVNGTYVGGVENPKYNGTISNGTRVDIGNAQGGPIGLLNVTGLNGIGIELPRSPENQGMGQMMKLPYRSPLPVDQEQEDKLFWQRVQKNITEGLPPNNGFTTELYPIASGYRNKRLRGDTSLIYTPQYIINMGGLLLGPVVINSTLSLLSFTIPIKKPDGQNGTQIVGFVTTVVSAKPLQEIISDTDGLGDTGQALLVGPAWVNGLWNDTRMSANKHSRGYVEDADKEIGDITSKITGDFEFVYLLRPAKSPKLAGKTFKLRYYDPVWILSTLGKGGTDLDTTNPLGESVAVGYTVPQIQENIPTLVDWGLLIEQGKSEAFEPISRLSHILYATVFSTFAVVMLIVWPLAHFSVQPILRLKRATENTTNCRSSLDSQGSASSHYDDNDAETGKICILCCFPNMQKRRKPADVKTVDDVRRRFRIPGKVKERKHFIHDELSSLTATYNQMTEELEMQYNTLEERVSQRTKALNEQTRLAEDHRKIAESANQAKSLFIANISHELRTPLGGMINMCDVAMEQAAAHSMIDVQESLQIAAMSGKSLLHLINELLTFSKNQVSVESQAEDEEFALVVIEKQLLAVFGKMAEERGVKLDVCNTPTDLLDHIFVADIKRITQCMYNLVGNGLKFTPRGGNVRLQMSLRPRITAFEVQRRVDVGSGPSTPESTLSRSASTATLSTNVPTPKHEEKTHILEFRVIDNGPGISPHLLEKVFEPFVQAEMRLAKVHEGVGLGLSICRQIIKMLGGSISLESEVDVGSIFTVQVPVGMRMREASDPPLICSKTPWGKDNKPHLASGSIIQGETELDGSLKILVAEDNPTNRTVIVQMLKLQKFLDVTLAKDGHEALAKIKEAMGKGEEFGVILMDIQMPGLDGIECTRTVRALGYTAPIVALTAFADEGNKNDCLDAGMNYFLPKPIDKHHLRAVLKTCMGFSCGTPLSSYIGTGLPTPPASATSMPMLGTPATELDSLTTPSAGPLKPPSP